MNCNATLMHRLLNNGAYCVPPYTRATGHEYVLKLPGKDHTTFSGDNDSYICEEYVINVSAILTRKALSFPRCSIRLIDLTCQNRVVW